MKKYLDGASITNELKGASLYFAREREEKQQQTHKPVSSPTSLKPVPVLPVRPVPPVRGTTMKRVMKNRHPFDIYRDQYDSLRQKALEDRMQGGAGSMSAMVREAIDRFLTEKDNKK